MSAHWTPGEQHGLAWPFGVALLDGAVDLETANRLWQRVRDVRELGDFLTGLSEALGTGLLDLPEFTVAVGAPGGSLHLAARGRFVATATAPGEPVAACGNGVLTWAERRVRQAAGVVLTRDGDASPTVPGRMLDAGVVPASAMRWAADGAAVPSPAGRPGAGFISAAPGSPGFVRSAPSVEHDGHTVARVPGSASSPPLVAPGHTRDLLAVRCPAGHANPPQRPTCRVCAATLSAAPVRVPRPVMGRVIATSGESLDLTGPVVVGRAPRASRFTGSEEPRLMRLPHSHISSSHLALHIEDWNVLVVDLGSTNGTFLRRSGQRLIRLSDTSQILVPGDVVDLGHGVRLRFEELP
ncbi:FHA domain-containing protein [Nocardioides sp. JQ2195]|uniref:FHA domain-containing protein n=1 Tax=Nocardioides sp. JQ2195 TaxID=2592334 RepID=UPI00143E2DBE|nr:FHA domain-containing protein [Nocardioides sp. JQ2195]QIX25407.1 FHA domain-containing protein [Nocardioides sp. JQ2195]